MTVDRPDGTVCLDGQLSGAIQTWSWDPETLNGEVSGVPMVKAPTAKHRPILSL